MKKLSSWRPIDWDSIAENNIRKIGGYLNPKFPIMTEDRLLFEAGADAMLEALAKEADGKEWRRAIYYLKNR